MLIVDAQVHIWSSGKPSGQHRQASSFSAEDSLAEMDAAGVDAAVLHPPGWDVYGVAVAEAAARRYPNRFAILGHFPLEKPENRPLIETWKNRPGMLGLRYAFTQPHQQNWMTDGTMDWLWPAAEKAGVPVALMASNYLPQVAQIAERHPGLKLIIDHYARARGGIDDAAHANQPALLALAKFRNVAVKATGAPGNSSEPYPYRNIHIYTEQIFDAFGPERMFWGTDITRMPCSWRQCVDDVYAGNAVPQGPRPRIGHGPRLVRLDRLEAITGSAAAGSVCIDAGASFETTRRLGRQVSSSG